MNFIQFILYSVNPVLLVFIIVGGTAALSVAGLLTVRKTVSIHKLKAHNDVAGFMFATLGVIYAVMLAFMVIISWQNFDASSKSVEKEANFLADLYRDSIAFAPQFRAELRAGLNAYIDSVVNEEWPLLSKGRNSPRAQRLSDGLYGLFASYAPRSETERIFLAESVRKLNEAGELRRIRLLDSRTGIEPAFWIVLMTGGIITIVFTFFFGTENYTAQSIMTALLAVMISMILYTIMLFDYPYTGSVNISPDAFRIVWENLSAVK